MPALADPSEAAFLAAQVVAGLLAPIVAQLAASLPDAGSVVLLAKILVAMLVVGAELLAASAA